MCFDICKVLEKKKGWPEALQALKKETGVGCQLQKGSTTTELSMPGIFVVFLCFASC